MGSRKGSADSVKTEVVEEGDWECRPEFIYGGPFVPSKKVEPFWNTDTPFNSKLQGTFKKSHAYVTLKDKMPVILTKIIDHLAKDNSKIRAAYSTNEADISAMLQSVAKLKNDVVTNKKYEPMEADTLDAEKWNGWIESQTQTRHFLNSWLFTECYIYRKLKDFGEMTKTLHSFDPFDSLKEQSVTDSLEPMCLLAEQVLPMLRKNNNENMKADFATLLKVCLWANRCDLSLSGGDQVKLTNSKDGITSDVIDPIQIVADLKDKILIDDSAKVVDTIISRAEALTKLVTGNTAVNKCSCHRLAALAKVPICKEQELSVSAASPDRPEGEEGLEEGAEETVEEKVPCPALMTVPQNVIMDVICDNAGFELFADFCFGHFLIAHNIVQKIRFHVKAIPWFVSDATIRDVKFLITHNLNATFTKTLGPKAEGESTSGEPKTINSDNLKTLATQWKQFMEDGTFIILAEDFWTYPHGYKDMKRIDFNLYRKLQFGCASLFKGDLNYRKLLGDKKANPCLSFEAALEGFIPAPVIALRTVKSEVICGLPKGKYQQLRAIDEHWMEKGDYGLIQICTKAEPLKASDRPCEDYGTTCFGTVCPQHDDV